MCALRWLNIIRWSVASFGLRTALHEFSKAGSKSFSRLRGDRVAMKSSANFRIQSDVFVIEFPALYTPLP